MKTSNAQANIVQSTTLQPVRFYRNPSGQTFADFLPQLECPAGLAGVIVLDGAGIPSRYTQTGRVESVGNTPASLPQCVVLFVGRARIPYVVGLVTPAGSTLPITSHATVNGGSTWEHSADGNMTAALTEAGTMTVSRDGNASGRLVLRDELLGYLNDLTAQLTTLLGRVAVCEAAIPIPPPIPPVTFPDPDEYTFGAAAIPVAPDAE